MLTLFQFPAAFDVPNLSPYYLKVETWLCMAGLEYRVKTVMNPAKGPKGKVPFIDLDGQMIADSAITLRTLSVRGTGRDNHLDATGRARALCITRLCDEYLAVLLLYFCWLEGEGWSQLKPALFGYCERICGQFWA